ncbi:putative LRR and NB-ARC domains-containing disease resistance protein [Quillaja saponaria]|uniref:LRR and NB-ARC domains-containing disease resistance protein n=1 Tax=Quillaja saponaria TaxID=32244 RepID=A0AAD7LK68_QUISA|nr:putative LRR and NB-ARC domains-containing disease resistance protein [Quillaja saponaria]
MRSLGRSPPIEVLKVAKSVAKECAGLPLGLVILGRSMSEVEDITDWNHVLKELQNSRVGRDDMERVFKVLRFSYDYLTDTVEQQCFLYCALYPEDYRIEREELIDKFVDEGLIDRTKSLKAKFDEGHTILNKLQNNCLLECVEDETGVPKVKMHDLFRDMAIKIQNESGGIMIKAKMRLEEIPQDGEWSEDLEKVSLMSNNIREINRSGTSTSPRCPNLSTLLLRNNIYLKLISDSFFLDMPSLSILDLSFTSIDRLPNSISELVNLTTLLLASCYSLTYLPPLGKLQALWRLDISGTEITEIEGLEMLVNLRWLNIYGSSLGQRKSVIPMISKLINLQFLSRDWHSEAMSVTVDDLQGLKKLEYFTGNLYDIDQFNAYVSTMKLKSYILRSGCGEFDVLVDKLAHIKCVVLDGSKFSHGLPVIKLPKDVEQLYILQFPEWRCLHSDVLFFGSSTSLRSCEISRCSKLRYLFSVNCPCFCCNSLQKLESLKLAYLKRLHVLCKEGGSAPTLLPTKIFSRLTHLQLSHCHKLRRLLTSSLLSYLKNLEILTVEYCDLLEEIFSIAATEVVDDDDNGDGYGDDDDDDDDDDDNDDVDDDLDVEGSPGMDEEYSSTNLTTINLPRLKILKLLELPKLNSVYRGVMVCETLQVFTIHWCQRLKEIPQTVPPFAGRVIF